MNEYRSAPMRIVDLRFCLVHGHAHNGDEDEGCRIEVWPDVLVPEAGDYRTKDRKRVRDNDPFYLLGRGYLAYIDTLRGLVPCKMLSVSDEGHATVKVTATRPGWARGEVVTFDRPGLSLVNRTQVFTRRGRRRISGRVRMLSDRGDLL